MVGHQPLLKPGEHFEYTSWAAIATPVGTMRGEYFAWPRTASVSTRRCASSFCACRARCIDARPGAPAPRSSDDAHARLNAQSLRRRIAAASSSPFACIGSRRGLLAGRRPHNDKDEQEERDERFQREDEHRVFVEQIRHGGFHQERTLYAFCPHGRSMARSAPVAVLLRLVLRLAARVRPSVSPPTGAAIIPGQIAAHAPTAPPGRRCRVGRTTHSIGARPRCGKLRELARQAELGARLRRGLADRRPRRRQRAALSSRAYFIPFPSDDTDGTLDGSSPATTSRCCVVAADRAVRTCTPLYGVPDDLLDRRHASLYPELKGKRLRGRLVGRTVVPYPAARATRARAARCDGNELVWVDDPIEAFFLRGAGLGPHRDGVTAIVMRLGFGGPEQSAVPVDRPLAAGPRRTHAAQATMQGIKAWARANPTRVDALLDANPRFVFFCEARADRAIRRDGPKGALGVPLTPERSIAVDPRIPLGYAGVPATTRPLTDAPMNRLVFAQDTGCAITPRRRARGLTSGASATTPANRPAR